MISFRVKGILTIIGSFLLLVILGSLYTWSNINGYYASYLKHHDSPDITIVDAYFLMPTIIFLSNIFSPAGAWIESKVGPRMTATIAITLTICSHIMLLLFTQLWMVYASMILFGIGVGTAHLSLLRNCWNYFPDKKGSLGGVIVAGFGLSAMLFTSICDYMVNPGGLVKPGPDGIYPKETAEKMHYYIFFKTCIFFFLGVIAVTFIFPYNAEEAKRYNSMNKTGDEEALKQKLVVAVVKAPEPVNAAEEPLSLGFSSKQFIMLSCLMFCTRFSGLLIANVNRTFGDRNGLDPLVLAYMSKGFSFLNGTLRVFWGFCYDKLGFKRPFLVMIIIQLTVTSTIYFIAGNETLYFIANMFVASVMAGNTALFAPVVSKIFGMKNASEIYAPITIFSGIAGLVGPIFAKLIVKEKEDYLILFWIGAGLSMMSLFIWCFLSEEKFDYGKAKEANEKKPILGDEELALSSNANSINKN